MRIVGVMGTASGIIPMTPISLIRTGCQTNER